MTSDRYQLERKFADFSDDELRKRWNAGHLTLSAQAVAAAEANSRGLTLDRYQSFEEPDEEPEAAPDGAEEYLGDWVLVARNLSPTEAHILCSFLSAHEVPATAADTNVVQANWLWKQAVGGASVRVPKTLFRQAIALLAERRRGSFALNAVFDPGEPLARDT